jgi:thioredoxin 1
MKPILEEVTVEYQGKLNVVNIEVYEQKDLTHEYGIMTVPTQILFDSKGKEVIRHVGFWAKKEITTQLKKMGVN